MSHKNLTKKEAKPEEEEEARHLKAPKFLAHKKLVKTREGETAKLTCKAKGVPMPELKWLKNDTEVIPDAEITIDTGDGETTLTITNAQPEHGGTYTCQATNPAGSVETNIELIVCETCASIRSKLRRKPLTVLLENELDEIKACSPELLQAINALMNGTGGYIIIHTTDPGYLDGFDQKVDNVLKTMIPYRSFYDDYFRRYITDDAQHVVFEVLEQAGDRMPYFLEFHSKVSLNSGVANLTRGQLQTCVDRTLEAHSSEESDTALATPRRDKLMANLVQGTPIMNNNVPFVENLSMQGKCPRENSVIVKKIKDSDSLVGELWSGDFKLVHYISAFSKLRDGGSFYFGVREEKKERRFFCNGFAFDEKQQVEIKYYISRRIERNMLWVGTRRPPQNLVTVKLHPVRLEASSEQQQTQQQEELQQLQKTQKQKKRKTQPQLQQQEQRQQEKEGRMRQDQSQPQATVSPPDAVTHGQRGSDDPAQGHPPLYILEIKIGYYAHGVLFHKKEGPDIYNICSKSKKPCTVKPKDWVKIYRPSGTIRSTPEPTLHPQCQ